MTPPSPEQDAVRHEWAFFPGSFAGAYARCRCGWESTQSHDEGLVRRDLEAHLATALMSPLNGPDPVSYRYCCGATPEDTNHTACMWPETDCYENGPGLPDPVSLEQRVAAVILEARRHIWPESDKLAAEVITLCRGATYRMILDALRQHYYDTSNRASKPDDPGWHACTCDWEGYWSDWHPHVAEQLAAAISPHPVVGGPTKEANE